MYIDFEHVQHMNSLVLLSQLT